MVAGDLGSLSSSGDDFGASPLCFLCRFFRSLDVEDFSLAAIFKASSQKRVPQLQKPRIRSSAEHCFEGFGTGRDLVLAAQVRICFAVGP